MKFIHLFENVYEFWKYDYWLMMLNEWIWIIQSLVHDYTLYYHLWRSISDPLFEISWKFLRIVSSVQEYSVLVVLKEDNMFGDT